jgi:hypothetical protein
MIEIYTWWSFWLNLLKSIFTTTSEQYKDRKIIYFDGYENYVQIYVKERKGIRENYKGY